MSADQVIPIAVDAVKRHFKGDGYRLEEYRVLNDGDVDVTVSYFPADPFTPGELINKTLVGLDTNRIYKLVRVDAGGQIKSVRVRKFILN